MTMKTKKQLNVQVTDDEEYMIRRHILDRDIKRGAFQRFFFSAIMEKIQREKENAESS